MQAPPTKGGRDAGNRPAAVEYYDLPSISLRSAVYPLMQAGIEGFKPGRVWEEPSNQLRAAGLRAAKPSAKLDFFYHDKTHPGDLGHTVLAELLAAALLRAVAEVEAGASSTSAQALAAAWPTAARQDVRLPGTAGLPPPMVPGNTDSSTTLCAIQEAFEPVVVASQGFAFKPERPDAPNFITQKWGWTAAEPGAWAELQFDTRKDPGAGDEVAPQQDKGDRDESHSDADDVDEDGTDEEGREEEEQSPNALLYLTYLKSYAGMGTASVACVRGCSCKKVKLDGTWAQPNSLQQVLVLRPSQHASCRVRVTVLKEAGRVRQQGHKVSLSGVMVSHFNIRLQSKTESVEVMHSTLG